MSRSAPSWEFVNGRRQSAWLLYVMKAVWEGTPAAEGRTCRIAELRNALPPRFSYSLLISFV